ncbi:hypothetical protein Pmani_005546 [Petrolisthes manimaculis]|uniref:VWFA domain-containing protein n=1 Tax=Petrolisthes manimaculis TaxID=1843537 RepID=A0AAE1QC07_9EUCA|nr:hypothetical protein Pmani_005546 [Petrolisthes manimaculis]
MDEDANICSCSQKFRFMHIREHLESLLNQYPDVETDVTSRALSLAHTLLSKESKALGLPDFPIHNLDRVIAILNTYPSADPSQLLLRLYPYHTFLAQETFKSVEDVFTTFDFSHPQRNESQSGDYEVLSVNLQKNMPGKAEATLRIAGREVTSEVLCGESWGSATPAFIVTPYHSNLLTDLVQSHTVGDFCLVGPRGCGKSAAIAKLAQLLGYQTEPILLYQDMTSRDLVQQRVTGPTGDTGWQFSPLVVAALEGKMAVLDGIHRLHHGTLAVLHRLIHDRELQLYDGTRLLHPSKYDAIKTTHNLTDEDMTGLGVMRIHPTFRVVALAEPPVVGAAQGQWLTPEALTLFLYHPLRRLTSLETIDLVHNLVGECSEPVQQLIGLSSQLASSTDPAMRSLAESLSLRQVIRVARRFQAYPGFDLHTAVYKACLARFLPPLARQALDSTLEKRGIVQRSGIGEESGTQLMCEVKDEVLRIGDTHTPIHIPDNNTKVPDTLFFDIQQHISVLENMLQDWLLGDHLLLVGNQGVGKNKLADRFLYLLSRPREYIQLHRDTTVQSLTIQPVVRDGRVGYEDSPLVVAVKTGRVLVVDEADKAPTHVTCVLKTLVESGEMLLSDGRRIVPQTHPLAASPSPSIIVSHPDFRMIVLANRPGFPFLGNDFFGALGDLFSCHAIDNPSVESELALLRSYGPDVPQRTMERLVAAFGELRDLADQALIQYPYSTREVVNIVKHLQTFPDDGVAKVVRNVVDFDSWSGDAREILVRVMHSNGIPIDTSPVNVNLAKKIPLPEPRLVGQWRVTPGRSLPYTSLMQLPVQHQSLRYKSAVRLGVTYLAVDEIEMRSDVFSEQQSYWALPVHDTALVTDVAVIPGGSQDPLEDHIYVATVAPAAIHSLVPKEKNKPLKQILLHEVLPSYRSAYQPRLKMVTLPDGNLVAHEEVSNTLLKLDVNSGSVEQIQLSSQFEAAAESLLKRIGATKVKQTYFRMCKDNASKGLLALWEVGGGSVLFVDLTSDRLLSLSLPLVLSSFHLIDDKNQWMAVDEEDGKWLLKGEDDQYTLHPINETLEGDRMRISCISPHNLSDFILSKALKQQISAPSRLFAPFDSLAAVAVGFPELNASENEVYVWDRDSRLKLSAPVPNSDPVSSHILLRDVGQVVKVVDQAPRLAFEHSTPPPATGLYLEVTDLINQSVSYVPVPRTSQSSPYWAWAAASRTTPLFIVPVSGNGLISVDSTGVIRLWQTGSASLERALTEWRKMIGEDSRLRLDVEKFSGKDVSEPKHGKEDPDNNPHVGGNMWAGGTGGRDTAGLGGMGGPYRLDAGHDVYQVTQAEKDAVPEEVRRAAHEMAQKAFKERLREIRMSEYDAGLYERLASGVQPQIRALRGIINSLQARGKERQWLRHRTSGELDDMKLIEGLAGERNIYRQRREEEPEVGAPQTHPKRLRLVVDVSGSMYRFNGHDGRLERELEATLMVMEAFEGFETKFKYDIYGHSGEEADVPFVECDAIPRNNKERLDVLKTMQAHSQFCLSGDHTLEAAMKAVKHIASEESDESFVILLSDANLERYGIRPSELAKALTAESTVNTYAIFIGSLGDQADRLTKALPAGHSFVCLDLKKIPQILQQIFTSAMIK